MLDSVWVIKMANGVLKMGEAHLDPELRARVIEIIDEHTHKLESLLFESLSKSEAA